MSREQFASPDDHNRSPFARATRQGGVVTRRQLLADGWTPARIRHALSTGWLHPLTRGVYSVGHARSDTGAVHAAALLAAGPGSALFRRSAALQLGLTTAAPLVPEAIVPARSNPRPPGIHIHRSTTIDPRRDIVVVRGLPCTTVARTLVDLAGVAGAGELARGARQAEFRRMLDRDAVASALERAGRPKGAGALRELLGIELTDSGFERELVAGLQAAAISPPRLQQVIVLPDGSEARVDLYWPARKLVVEADGPHHELPLFRAQDAARDAGLKAGGHRVMRVPKKRWRREPHAVLEEIRTAVLEP